GETPRCQAQPLPFSVKWIKRIDSQIATLRASNLSELDLIEYRNRAERIKRIFLSCSTELKARKSQSGTRALECETEKVLQGETDFISQRAVLVDLSDTDKLLVISACKDGRVQLSLSKKR